MSQTVYEIENAVLDYHNQRGSEGILIDQSWREMVKQELISEMAELQSEADAFAGYPIKLTSRKQVAELLYDVFALTNYTCCDSDAHHPDLLELPSQRTSLHKTLSNLPSETLTLFAR